MSTRIGQGECDRVKHMHTRWLTMDDSTTIFMSELDEEYREVSGLNERRFYSIFYSRIEPSPIFLLGINPGGDPDEWDMSFLASKSLYENYEHEYVDCSYPIANAMLKLLKHVLETNDKDVIRRVPKSNIIFRRSSSLNKLPISKEVAYEESRPFVQKMLVRVNPKCVVFESVGALDEFCKRYCRGVKVNIDQRIVRTPNGSKEARIYQANTGYVECLGKELLLIGLGHPSKYATRKEWNTVLELVRGHLGAAFRPKTDGDEAGTASGGEREWAY